MSLNIVPKAEWRGRAPLGTQMLVTPVNYVLLYYHTPKLKPCGYLEKCCKRLRRHQEYQMLFMGFPDIQYNFLIGGDGRVYEGRGWTVNPSKAGYDYWQYFKKSLDIAYIGKHIDVHPTPKMVSARKALINFGIKKNYISPEHRRVHIRETTKKTEKKKKAAKT